MYIIRLPNDCFETYVKFSLLCIIILVGSNGKLYRDIFFDLSYTLPVRRHHDL